MSVDTLYEHRCFYINSVRQLERRRGEEKVKRAAARQARRKEVFPGSPACHDPCCALLVKKGSALCCLGLIQPANLSLEKGGGNECNREMFPVSSVDRLWGWDFEHQIVYLKHVMTANWSVRVAQAISTFQTTEKTRGMLHILVQCLKYLSDHEGDFILL